MQAWALFKFILHKMVFRALYITILYVSYFSMCKWRVSGEGFLGSGSGGIRTQQYYGWCYSRKGNRNFNIKDILNNESNSLYSNSNHSCKYHDFDSFKEKTEKLTDNTSILSCYIISLTNKWSHFEDFVSNDNSTKFKLSVIGLSKIWNMENN